LPNKTTFYIFAEVLSETGEFTLLMPRRFFASSKRYWFHSVFSEFIAPLTAGFA